jgi:hypothetical protein
MKPSLLFESSKNLNRVLIIANKHVQQTKLIK